MPTPSHSPAAGLVHAPLARWACKRTSRPAIIQDAHSADARHISFGELYTQLQTAPLPPALLTCADDPLALLTAFLTRIARGGCAAVADPDWPTALHAQMAARLEPLEPPVPAGLPTPDTLFYTGFTSGSTGLPKGFQRNHRSWVETFRVTLQDFGPVATQRVLAPGRMSHSLFLFGALLGLWAGGGTSVQRRFSAARTLATLADGSCPVMISVPSQLMMLLTTAARRRIAPIPALKLLLVSGARWTHEHTPQLQALFPEARIITFYGASETSYISWMETSATTPPHAVGRPFSNVRIHIGPADTLPQTDVTHTHPGADTGPRTQAPASPSTGSDPGLIWVRSPMLFSGYLPGDDATAAWRVGEWLSVRDMGWLDAQGMLHLAGRENRMIVTQARNLFPEEVEARLQAHPRVARACVLGMPDPQRGQVVHAIVDVQAEAEAGALAPLPDALATQLATWCTQTLERYKVPRHWWVCPGPDWPQTTSGKTDHDRLRALVAAHSHHP